VTEFVPDTPSLARCYCPGCEPDADPLLEILDVRWCEAHVPPRDGMDDGVVVANAFLSGSAEAGGDDNRRWCEIVHGAGRLAPAARPLRRERARAPRA
jgi:hypothetical protein